MLTAFVLYLTFSPTRERVFVLPASILPDGNGGAPMNAATPFGFDEIAGAAQ
jgi:hypothetical protein